MTSEIVAVANSDMAKFSDEEIKRNIKELDDMFK